MSKGGPQIAGSFKEIPRRTYEGLITVHTSIFRQLCKLNERKKNERKGYPMFSTLPHQSQHSHRLDQTVFCLHDLFLYTRTDAQTPLPANLNQHVRRSCPLLVQLPQILHTRLLQV